MKIAAASWLLLLGVLIGSSIGCHFFSATVVFDLVGEAVEDTSAAGTIAGGIFHSYHLFAVYTLPLLLAGWFWLRRGMPGRGWLVAGLLIAAGILLATELLYITPRIHELREELGAQFGTVSEAPAGNPLRREFGRLHGVSMMRALIEMVLMAAAFFAAQLPLRRAVR